MDIFQVQSSIMLVVVLCLLAVKGYAFVSSLMFPAEAYEAAGKLTKVAWNAILGLGFVAQLIFPGALGLLSIAFTIAAFVYLADVKPAVRALTRR